MRVAWLGGAALLLASIAHASTPDRISSWSLMQLDDEAAFQYFATLYAEPQDAVDEALHLFRQLLKAEHGSAIQGASNAVYRKHQTRANAWSRFTDVVISWSKKHQGRYAHDASGVYTGPLRNGIAALLLWLFDTSPTSPTSLRSAHTYYDMPDEPLWPDWDYDISKAQAATYAARDPPVLNGWEQAMWGPFIGPVHDVPSEHVQHILHRVHANRTRTALADLVYGSTGGDLEPAPMPPSELLVAQRKHAVRLLQWVGLVLDAQDAKSLIHASFAHQQGHVASATQMDALWILGEHAMWGTHGAAPNMTLAITCFERLAAMGNATAHARLGYLHSSPLLAYMYDTTTSAPQALVHYTLGAQEGDRHARLALAYRNQYGVGVAQNCLVSLEWYDLVATRTYERFQMGPPGGRTMPYTKVRLSDLARMDAPGLRYPASYVLKNGLVYKLARPAIRILLDTQPRLLYDPDAARELVELYRFYTEDDALTKRLVVARALFFGSFVGNREALGAVPVDPATSAQLAYDIASKRWPTPPTLDDINASAYVNGELRATYRHRDQTATARNAALFAASLLGYQYLRGEGVPQDFVQAKVWWTRAALEQHGPAQYGLGLMYANGYGGLHVNQTHAHLLFNTSVFETMSSWVERGKMEMEAKDLEAAKRTLMHALYMVIESTDRGPVYLDTKLEAGYLYAGLLADEVYHGHNTTSSCEKAVPILQEVAELGDWDDPMHHRADAAFDRGDTATALLAWSAAAETGADEAMDNIAFVLDQFTSWHHTPSPQEADQIALQYWSHSALQGSEYAQFKVCDYYFHGLAPGGLSRAVSCFRALTEENVPNVLAVWRLASMYENGIGVPVDFPLAKRYYDMVLADTVQARSLSPSLALLRQVYHIRDANLAISLELTRLHAKALWAMLHGDLTARRLFAAYLPTLPRWLHIRSWTWDDELVDVLLELTIFALGVLLLVVLSFWRRYVQRRLNTTEQQLQQLRAMAHS